MTMKPGELPYLAGSYLMAIGAALVFLYGQTDPFLLSAGGCFAIIGCYFFDLEEISKEVA